MPDDRGKIVYDLMWIDPALHDVSGDAVAAFERIRRFPHCGAAIAWARRQLFHGKVFGSHVEMRKVHVDTVNDKVFEHVEEVVDITLLGFQRWEAVSSTRPTYQTNSTHTSGTILNVPERKCRTMR